MTGRMLSLSVGALSLRWGCFLGLVRSTGTLTCILVSSDWGKASGEEVSRTGEEYGEGEGDREGDCDREQDVDEVRMSYASIEPKQSVTKHT